MLFQGDRTCPVTVAPASKRIAVTGLEADGVFQARSRVFQEQWKPLESRFAILLTPREAAEHEDQIGTSSLFSDGYLAE
jgi:hypothetical protein